MKITENGNLFFIRHQSIRIRCQGTEKYVKLQIQDGTALATLGLGVKSKFYDSSICTSSAPNAAAAYTYTYARAVAFLLILSNSNTNLPNPFQVPANYMERKGNKKYCCSTEQQERGRDEKSELLLLPCIERARMSYHIFSVSLTSRDNCITSSCVRLWQAEREIQHST